MDRFNHLLNMSDTIQKFEEKWDCWMKDNNIQDNAWLESMFQLCHKWCPVFTRDFLGGMQSKQRSEDMNALVKTGEKTFNFI